MDQSPRNLKWLFILLQPIYLLAAFACLCTLAAFLGQVFWAFEFASYFYVQYCMVLLISTLIFIISRKRSAAIISAMFAAINLIFLVPFYAPIKPGSPGGSVYSAVLVNLLKENQNHEAVRSFIHSSDPDIVIFQEITPVWEEALNPLHDKYPFWETEPHLDHTGIAIFSQIPYKNVEIRNIGEDSPPSVVAYFQLNDANLTVIGTHPNPPYGPLAMKIRVRHFEELIQLISNQPDAVLVLGDLNMTFRSSLFQWFLRESGLRDSRRGFGWQATWPVTMPLLATLIDHVLVSNEIHILNRELGPNVGSDHYPVIIEFSIR